MKSFYEEIVLPAQHIPELLHVPSGGDVPAEIRLHVPLLQGAEGFPVMIVQAEAALQRREEIVGVVALEGEAQAALAVFVGGRNGVLQAAGSGEKCMDLRFFAAAQLAAEAAAE